MAFTDILSDLGSFSNPFGPPSVGKWNLQRGVYIGNTTKKSVIFFYEDKDPNPSQHTAVDQVSDTGGRRLAVFEYPYVDGQKITDLGRRGETYVFNIKFHGVNYQTLFNQFIDVVVNQNEQGTIVHPIRGALIVRFKEYEFQHRYDEWNAVTIKATFIEDNTGAINLVQTNAASQDSALRSALQTLTNAQAQISQGISDVSAALLLPAAISGAMSSRLTSITSQVSGLLGQLAATFSSNAQLQNLASQSQGLTGGVTGLNAGTTQSGTLPPVYQAGFDPATQSAVANNLSAFVNANQVTPQTAVFNANQARSAILAAINEVNTNFGNQGYALMVAYRGLAVSIQNVTQSCIASIQTLVVLYTVPVPMSLRTVAFNNGLTPDRQNDIEALNPYLGSVNVVPANTVLTVPAA